MPKSKKRVKKQQPEVRVAKNNFTHTKWGKAIIVALAASFALTGLIGLFYIFYQIATL